MVMFYVYFTTAQYRKPTGKSEILEDEKNKYKCIPNYKFYSFYFLEIILT